MTGPWAGAGKEKDKPGTSCVESLKNDGNVSKEHRRQLGDSHLKGPNQENFSVKTNNNHTRLQPTEYK